MNGEEGGECTSSFPETRRGVEEKGKTEEKEKKKKGKTGRVKKTRESRSGSQMEDPAIRT